VLAFQPEATRVQAEGRRDALDVSMRAFFKASVMLAMLAAVGIVVYAVPLIELAANRDFLAARPTLWLLAATIPMTAMTAPLTAIMKALDGVRSALYCDLAWASVYLTCLVVLTAPLGVEGAGVAQLCACLVQVVFAFRLAKLRPRGHDVVAAVSKSLVSAGVAFVLPVVAFALHAPLLVPVVLAPLAVWIFLSLARRLRVFSADERDRLLQVAAGRRMATVAGWLA
jgi:O-antigen/teichoic acid export membrane protein